MDDIRTVISAAVFVQIQPSGSGPALAALICKKNKRQFIISLFPYEKTITPFFQPFRNFFG